MPEDLVLAALGVAGLVVTGLVLFARREAAPAVAFADEREERLTRRLAETLRCGLAQALPLVREELRLGPGQSDETLLKRAAYHYRRNLPEKACHVYRDRAPG